MFKFSCKCVAILLKKIPKIAWSLISSKNIKENEFVGTCLLIHSLSNGNLIKLLINYFIIED